MNRILAVALIVLGIFLFMVGIGLAIIAPIGGRTDSFVFEIAFIALGFGCIGYGAIVLHDYKLDKKLEQEKQEKEESNEYS